VLLAAGWAPLEVGAQARDRGVGVVAGGLELDVTVELLEARVAAILAASGSGNPDRTSCSLRQPTTSAPGGRIRPTVAIVLRSPPCGLGGHGRLPRLGCAKGEREAAESDCREDEAEVAERDVVVLGRVDGQQVDDDAAEPGRDDEADSKQGVHLEYRVSAAIIGQG
jgi:hypothetical protein